MQYFPFKTFLKDLFPASMFLAVGTLKISDYISLAIKRVYFVENLENTGK